MAETVGQILNDRHQYHGRITRDPLEPDYDGGRPTGKLFLLDARPTLFSFAHGGRSFRLIRSPQRVEIVTGRMAVPGIDMILPGVGGTGPAFAVFGAGAILATFALYLFLGVRT